jgi:hypothetical protein
MDRGESARERERSDSEVIRERERERCWAMQVEKLIESI